MPVFPTYSKSVSGFPEEFKYDNIPEELLNQIFHIWKNFFDEKAVPSVCYVEIWKVITNTIFEEHGILKYPTSSYSSTTMERALYYMKTLQKVDKVLDVIQISFFYMGFTEQLVRNHISFPIELPYKITEALNDLNTRFKENGVGYRYESGKIIRVDNELLHAETVTKVMSLVGKPAYKNVNDEYLKALDHHRKGNNPDCLTWCLSAFESTIKIIAHKNGWQYEENWTASQLIKLIFEKQFLPQYHEQALTAIKNFITNSLPPTRNKHSSHGRGTKVVVVPDSIVNYMIYTTGATIRLLIETQNEKEKVAMD